ncbi:MAG: hypothetical protein ACXWQO_19665 [Bdellovibrionota bacterium]
MSKREFKVGDMVRIFSEYGQHDGKIDAIAASNGHIRTEKFSTWYHPKQCRRLIRKAKPAPAMHKRIQRWLATPNAGTGACAFWSREEAAKYPMHDPVHLVELKSGEVITNKLDLLKAVQEYYSSADMNSMKFNRFCDSLGIPSQDKSGGGDE